MSLAGTAGTGFAEKAVREATPVPKKPTATGVGFPQVPGDSETGPRGR